MTSGFTRRRFLATTAAGALIVVVPRQALGNALRIDEPQVRVGVLADAERGDLWLLSRASGSTELIRLGPDTEVSDAGDSVIAGPTLGAELIAIGHPESRGFRARSLDRLYRAFNGRLDAVSSEAVNVAGTPLAMTGDTVVVDAATDRQVPLEDAHGRIVHALAWFRPAARDLEAARIYVS